MNSAPQGMMPGDEEHAAPSLEMQAWLSEMPASDRSEVERTWHLAGLAQQPLREGETVEQAVRCFQRMLEEEAGRRTEGMDRVARSRRRTRFIWPQALAAMIVLGVIGVWFWMGSVTVRAPLGEVRAVDLPDGSHVTLNSGTQLSYRRGLRGAARRVEVEGEAFFGVQQAARPFVVETFNAEVKVLGTRFNVRAWPRAEAPETAVALVEGSVRLTATATAAHVVLTAGQAATVARDAIRTIETALLDVATAWQNGDLAFLNAPVGTVLDELERRFNVGVQAPSALRRDSLSLFLRRPQHVEEVLADVCRYLGCTYRSTHGGYKIVVSEGREGA